MKQFLVTLRLTRRSIISWSLGVAAYLALMGIIYDALGGAEELSRLAEAYPQELLEAFAEDFSSIEGFIDAEAGTFFPVVFGIYLVMASTRWLAGAEESGVLDHFLARPVGRDAYYWNILLAITIGFAAICVAALIGAELGFIGETSGKDAAGLVGWMAEHFILGLLFIGLGGLLGSAFHRRGQANAVGAGIVVAWWVMEFAARTVDQLAWMSYWTPMGYRTRSHFYTGDPDPAFLVICIIGGAALAVAGWLVFRRKNLYA